MYSSQAFALWRYSLSMAELDIKFVFDRDLEAGPLREDGWTEETLQILVDWDFEVTKYPQLPDCTDCRLYRYPTVQPLWLYALAEIKNGKPPEDTVWAWHTHSDNQAGFVYDDEVIPTSQVPDPDEETERLRLRNPESGTSSSFRLTDANQEIQDELVAGSEKSDLDSETEDFVSVTSELDEEDPPFPYGKNDWLCITCWQYFRQNGRRRGPEIPRTSNSDCGLDKDLSDDEEYSPFQINW